MITEHDLREAIAECEGIRDPTANTCIKLAAYYILLDHLTDDLPVPSYSYAEPPETSTTYSSGTEFGKMIDGMDADDVFTVIDEAMSIVQGMHPRLFRAILEKLAEKKGVF